MPLSRNTMRTDRFKGGFPKTVTVAFLVLVVVTGMLVINVRLIMNVKQSIIEVVDTDIRNITQNAAMGRILATISADTELLVNTFTRKEVLLRSDAALLTEQLNRAEASFSDDTPASFHEAFTAYADIIRTVLLHCAEIDAALSGIRDLDRDIDHQLSMLTNVLADQEVTLMAEGGGRFLIDKVARLLPALRQYYLQISNRIYRFNQQHVLKKAIQQREKRLFLSILDKFDTALSELAISGAAFSEVGRTLRQRVFQYRGAFIDYYTLLQQFLPLLSSMHRSQDNMVLLSARLDNTVKSNSERTTKEISDNITTLSLISTGLFFLFNGLTAFLCFNLIRMFKIRQMAADLQKALDEIKTLRGIIPICSSCKKIRDDQGYWNQIEVYLRDHSDAEFSHGICPECLKRLYPDVNLDTETQQTAEN